MPERVLQLAGREPVAVGKWRLVYEHPDGSGRIVKVARSETIERVAAGAPFGLRRMRGYYHREVELRRELAEYRRAERWPPEERRFLQRFEGLARTDLGPGLVAGAVRTAMGELAPTLGRLLEMEVDPAGWQPDLDAFLAWFVASPLVVRDFRLQNLVHDEVGGHFVLIDGFGDRTVIPFRVWSSRLNRREKEKAAGSLSRAVDRVLARSATPSETGRSATQS